MSRSLLPLGVAAITAAWLIYLSDLAIGIFAMFGDAFWAHMPGLAPWRVYAAAFAMFLFPLLAACGGALAGLVPQSVLTRTVALKDS